MDASIFGPPLRTMFRDGLFYLYQQGLHVLLIKLDSAVMLSYSDITKQDLTVEIINMSSLGGQVAHSVERRAVEVWVPGGEVVSHLTSPIRRGSRSCIIKNLELTINAMFWITKL